MKFCTQITKDGHQCTRKCKGNSKYCWQHQKNSNISSKKSSNKSPKKLLNKSPEEIQRKYCNCVISVKQKQPNVNAFAICTASVGRINNNCKQYE